MIIDGAYLYHCKVHLLIFIAKTRENYLLFEKNARDEIMKIIFDSHQDVTSPRVYNNINNQRLIFIRIEQLIQKLDPKIYIEPLNQSLIANVQNKFTGPQTTNKKLMKATNSVAFSEELEVIKHADK